MNRNFNRNLILGFSISLLLLVVSSVASFVSIRGLIDASGWVDHTNVVLQRLEATLSAVKDAETGQRGYLLTGSPGFLEVFEKGSSDAKAMLRQVQELTADNPVQQRNTVVLDTLISRRLMQLKHLINLKQSGNVDLLQELNKGLAAMRQVRSQADRMNGEEERLMIIRTAKMKMFIKAAPFIIFNAGLLALLITVFFYLRIRKDFANRIELQNELQAKDEDITRRINIIRNIANRISDGDYTVQAADTGDDGLGSLSMSLNKMAESLGYSFGLLSDKEWLQAGIATLNQQMLAEQDLQSLSDKIIRFVATYTGSEAGAFYLTGSGGLLHLQSSFALSGMNERRQIRPGDGPAGEAVKSNMVIHLKEIPAGTHTIDHAAGKITPGSLIALPVLFDEQPFGVIELSSIKQFSANALTFLESITRQVGIVINSTQNRIRIQQMLEETQAQSEELQAQHSELEHMNTELEAQSQNLQASEEELRVQQEELLQANQELEERTHMLEERNEIIAQRNEDIQQKAAELAQSTKYKSEFLANMSHELRTPLNSILLLSRLIAENREENLTPDQIEFSQVIQSSGNGLLTLIDEILDLSKIEAGKMELEYSSVRVAEIVADMKGLFGAMAREKGLSLVVQIAGDVPELLDTDKLRLEQILKNLLSNSIKFTSAGSITIVIARNGNDRIKFNVADTGIGIAPEKQSLIFEAFQQADGSTRRKFGGTGLGLSISRELSRLLGGNLTLDSTPGAGSTFILDIPLGKPAEISDIATPATAVIKVPNAPLAPPETALTLERKRFLSIKIPAAVPDDRHILTVEDKVVLIVEDDTPFAKALLDYTRSKGYKGIVAVRGDEGLALARTLKPVAILLDIELPVKDGWEVMDELKADPQTRHIPVHIMSSHESKRESMEKGAVDFINKPFSFDQMKEVFDKLEKALKKDGKKVLIVEENPRHAKALSHFLETFQISSETAGTIDSGIELLQKKEVDCVILDMGIPDKSAYDTLDNIKKNPALEDVPIIIFTGKSLSQAEEQRIRQYADSIVIKTAHSYKRMLDEVSLFLHLMEESGKPEKKATRKPRLSALTNILQGKNILIADDDIRNIFSLTKSLEQHGINVIAATDGREALQLLEKQKNIDLVLMDMMMPEMDGYESTARIRQNPATKNLPVIAVTAKTMTGDRQKCIAAGASDYISKPVDIDQLLSLLRVWLYERSLHIS